MAEGSAQLRDLARVSTRRVVGFGASATLLFTAFVQILFPPEGETDLGRRTALLCCMAAAACLVPLGAGRFRDPGQRAGWVFVIAVVAALGGVSWVQTVSGMVGPWSAQYLLGWLLVVVAGASLGGWGAALGVVVSLLVLLSSVVGAGPTDVLDATPFVVITRTLQVVVLGLGAVAVLRLLDRAAAVADAEAEALDEELARAEALLHAGQATDELRRTLHDTAINTLEAISSHGDLLGHKAIAARCHSDIGVLDEWLRGVSGDSHPIGLRPALEREAARASERGIHVVVRESSTSHASQPPEPVVTALTRAVREALTNVAKHAATDRAEIVIELDDHRVRVEVRDDGRGFAAAPSGIGISESLVGRLEAVRGRAEVRSEPGAGTTVVLEWMSTEIEERPPTSEWSTRLARLVAIVGTSVAVVSLLGLLIGWQSLSRPAVALVAACLPLGWLAWLLVGVARGHRVSGWDAAATIAVVAASALLGPHADPYCTGSLGELASFEVRVTVLGSLVLWRPRVRMLVVSTVAVLVIGAVQGWQWHAAWADCGSVSWMSSLLGALALGTAWWVGRATDRQNHLAQRSRRRAVEARAAVESLQLIADEATAWTQQALSASRELLKDVIAALPARDAEQSSLWESTRRRCSLQAESLRSLIGLGTGVAPLARLLRSWVVSLNPAGSRVIVRGRLRGLDPPDGALAQLAGLLDSPLRGATYVLLGWRDGHDEGLVLTGPAGAFSSRPDVVAVADDASWSVVLDRDDGTESVACTWIWGV